MKNIQKKCFKASLAMLLSLCLFCSSLTVMAAELTYSGEEIESITGSIWQGGDTINASEGAIMINYRFENTSRNAEDYDALKAEAEKKAQADGAMYAVNADDPDYQYVRVIVLGNGHEYAVQAAAQGMTRRFSHSYTIWSAVDGAAGWQVAEVEEQDYYVSGDNQYPCYYITLVPYTAASESGMEKNASGDSCSHVFDYVITQEPTADTDGVMSYQCIKCGDVIKTYPVSALIAFMENAKQSILNAKEGETVTVSTELWTCFNREVIEAIAERTDVTVTVNYKYQNIYYTVTIPAGADVSQLLNEEGFCGFRYLDKIFNGSKLEKEK